MFSFSGVPTWFYILAFIVVVAIIVITEILTRGN